MLFFTRRWNICKMGKYGNPTGNMFRLSICLKRFYSDERKRCYVTVLSGLRVRWLARRLRRLFSLRGPFCLLAAGHLLPPDECLALLRPDEVVEAIPKHYRIFEDSSESEDEQMNTTQEKTVTTQNVKQANTIPRQNNAEQTGNRSQQTDDEQTNMPFTWPSSNCSSDNTVPEKCPEDNLNSKDGNVDLQETQNSKLEEIQKEELEEVKRKALELLDQCSDPPEEEKRKALELLDQCSDPPKRKRKRVRRRKPRGSSAGPQAGEPGSPSQDEADDTGLSLGADVSGNAELNTPASTPILRNNIEQNRAARLVYSLS